MAESQVERMRKAYAEIMLNMAQESAGRVLAAERRAAALAGGLAAARDDGVAALVRLKAIMEARIKEVESQSFVHIKELQDTVASLQEQLRGAQDTAASHQIELQRTNSELEQTKSTLAEERRNNLRTCDKFNSNKNSSSASKKHLQGRLSSKSKNTAKEGGAVENLEILYRCGSDLGSFIARGKNPELYRNGCTQRIRAIKQRSPSMHTSLVKNSKQTSALNSHSKTGKIDTNRKPHSTGSIMEQILQTKFLANCKRKRGRRSRPSYMHANSGEHGQAEYKSSDTSDGNGCLLLLQALEQDLSPLKASAGHDSEGLTDQKDEFLIEGADCSLHPASPGSNDVLSINNMRMKRRKRSKTIRVCESGFEAKGASELCNTVPKSANDNNTLNSEQSSDTPHGNNSHVLQCTAENLMHVTDASNTGQLKSENNSSLVPQSTESEIGDEGNSLVGHQLRTPENNAVVLEEMHVDKHCILASNGADSSNVSSLDKEENGKAPSEVAVQAEGARYIKYTFNRRKRKTASLDSTPQGAVPEKTSSLVCSTENHELHAKPEKQDLLIESPPADNQLIHVAQQLMLLSAQK